MRYALGMLMHNLIGHPVIGVLYFAADLALMNDCPGLSGWLSAAASKVHESTLPDEL